MSASNDVLAEGQVAWAASAAQNTLNTINLTQPYTYQPDALYLLTLLNPSTVTDLEVRVRGKESFQGVAYYPELTSFDMLKSQPDGQTFVIQGWLLGEGGRIELRNKTALGAGQGFTARYRVRRV